MGELNITQLGGEMGHLLGEFDPGSVSNLAAIESMENVYILN